MTYRNSAKNNLLKLHTSSYHFGGLQNLSLSANLLSLFPPNLCYLGVVACIVVFDFKGSLLFVAMARG